VNGLLQKHGAEIVRSQKWGERKLAYDIGEHKRGTYLLAYFKLDPQRVADLRHDINLSEKILRHLFVALEEIPPETATIALREDEELVLGGPEEEMFGRGGRRDRDRDRGDRDRDRGPAVRVPADEGDSSESDGGSK
jgi:small subunit ribosomal protein S6